MSPPQNPSLIPDKELRPWIECKQADEAIENELTKINDILALTSPIKNAGFQGDSQLDMQPEELLAFLDLTEKPGWMGYDEPEVLEIEQDKVNAVQLPENDSIVLEDPTVRNILNKINDLTINIDNINRNKLARLRTMHLLPIDTMIGVRSNK
jgi:hypothetical protein